MKKLTSPPLTNTPSTEMVGGTVFGSIFARLFGNPRRVNAQKLQSSQPNATTEPSCTAKASCRSVRVSEHSHSGNIRRGGIGGPPRAFKAEAEAVPQVTASKSRSNIPAKTAWASKRLTKKLTIQDALFPEGIL